VRSTSVDVGSLVGEEELATFSISFQASLQPSPYFISFHKFTGENVISSSSVHFLTTAANAALQ
jgi:hypothetical protein